VLVRHVDVDVLTNDSDPDDDSLTVTDETDGMTRKMDNKPWKRCTSPKVYRNLKLGKHIFKVRTTDPAGNTDSSPAKRRFKIVKQKKKKK